ncbi:hypothetical protein J2X20_003332 [Pelomonas saccharophila]|uniref:Eco29kI family restriction endonuclease n=1 Tax=Roseateles saccharophilus TaxID=304 RepID=A0ABU1YPA3_ROSSA|nr:Eco29kI family restriction endonuclease [Roseateles saccharophilus]MDR7270674.1 hypothetical protein [Roseateles saccharophilus]
MSSKNQKALFPSLIDELNYVADRLVAAQAEGSPRVVKRVREALETVSQRLAQAAAGLDPVIRPSSTFDPTNPATAGRIVALTMVAQARYPLSRVPVFYGSGVYALYYIGKEGVPGWVPAYAPLAGTQHPIYVGKADPIDPAAKEPVAQGQKLAARLREHAKTIGKATTTLDIHHFECRFLIVQTGFQSSAERYLIDFFKPIWNSETKICYGMSKHGDSAETRGNGRSPWHTMHPGVGWSDNERLVDQRPKHQIELDIAAHLATNRPYTDLTHIFDNFVADMKQLRVPLASQEIDPNAQDELDQLSDQPDITDTPG